MPLVFAAILPHGSAAIPAVAGPDEAAFQGVRAGLLEAGRQFSNHPADVLVVLTPHGIRAERAVALSVSERTEGRLTQGSTVLTANYAVDADLARRTADAARARNIPTALLAYGAASGPMSCLPMDWGAQVPLHFLIGPRDEARQVVTAVPSRALSFSQLAVFGEALADVLAADPRPAALIASADLCHAHLADGPYGHHPAAKVLDAAIQAAVAADRLEDVLREDEAFAALIANGKPDGLWQMAVLAGARRRVALRAHYLGYHVPTYFGMLSSVYLPQ